MIRALCRQEATVPPSGAFAFWNDGNCLPCPPPGLFRRRRHFRLSRRFAFSAVCQSTARLNSSIRKAEGMRHGSPCAEVDLDISRRDFSTRVPQPGTSGRLRSLLLYSSRAHWSKGLRNSWRRLQFRPFLHISRCRFQKWHNHLIHSNRARDRVSQGEP